MGAAVNALALLGLILGFALPVAAAERDGSNTERTARPGADRWVPSLSLISIATVQGWNAAVESEICRDCSFPSPSSGLLRPTASGSDLDVSPFLGVSIEMMSPELPLPLSPRVFIGAEIAATFGTERKIAREGDPGALSSPFPPGNENLPFDQDAVLGQGSQTLAKLQGPFYSAYVGVAFPFEFMERQLRIKPAIGWIHYEVEVSGLLVDAECATSGATTNCNGALASGFSRDLRLQGKKTGSFDGFGPALDLEMDTGPLGPVNTALFIGARAYRILDSRVEFSTSRSDNDVAGVDESRARFQFDADAWMLRIDLGMRFQWHGLGG